VPITEDLYLAVALADPECRWELIRGQSLEKPEMATTPPSPGHDERRTVPLRRELAKATPDFQEGAQ
jgi:hypothetical protein